MSTANVTSMIKKKKITETIFWPAAFSRGLWIGCDQVNGEKQKEEDEEEEDSPVLSTCHILHRSSSAFQEESLSAILTQSLCAQAA